MLNASDVSTLRQQGMTNRQILEMMAPVVPSAKRALQQINMDSKTPEWQVDSKIGKMLDKGVPRNAPSGLPYVMAANLNKAQEVHDEKMMESALPSSPKPGFWERLGSGVAQTFWQGDSSMLGLVTGTAKGIATGVDESASALNRTLMRVHGGVRDERGYRLKETGHQGPNINGPIDAVTSVTGELAFGAAKGISEPVTQLAGNTVAPAAQAAMQSPGVRQAVQPVLDTVQQGADAVNTFAQKNPQTASQIGALGKIASLPLAMQGAEQTYTQAGKLVEGVGKGAYQAGVKTAGMVDDAAAAVRQGAGKVQGMFGPKPMEPRIEFGKPQTYDRGLQKILLSDGSAMPTRGKRLYRAMSEESYQEMIRTGKLPVSAPEPGQTTGRLYFSASDEAAEELARIYGSDQRLISIDASKIDDLLPDPHTAGPININAYSQKPLDIKGIDVRGPDGVFRPLKVSYDPPKNIQSMVQPKATSKVIKETLEKNPQLVQEGGLIRRGKILPSERERDLAWTAADIEGFGKRGVVSNAKAVHSAIGKEAESLRQAFQAKNGALPLKESTSAVSRALEKAGLDFGEQHGVFKSMANIWKQVRSRHPGTQLGEWEARIAFDQELAKRFGTGIFEKGSARAVAAQTAREASNTLLNTYAQTNGVSYAEQLAKMSKMYEILENLATKAGEDTLRSSLSKFARSSIGRAAGTAAGVTAGLRVVP